MDKKEKLKTVGIIESAAVELKSLLETAQKFTDGKANNRDLKEIDFCLSKMEEHVYKLNNLYLFNTHCFYICLNIIIQTVFFFCCFKCFYIRNKLYFQR